MNEDTIYFVIFLLLFALNIFLGYKFVKRCKFNIFPVILTFLTLLSNLVLIFSFDKKFKGIKIIFIYFRDVNLKDLALLFLLIFVVINALYVIITLNLNAHKILPWMLTCGFLLFLPLSILWALTIKLYSGNDKSCYKELK